MLIHVDDGSSETYENSDNQEVVTAVGDSVSRLVGVLSYSYGNYKIEPTAKYAVQNQLPEVIPLECPGSWKLQCNDLECGKSV